MNRRTFQLMAAPLVLVLCGVGAVMISIDQDETAFGLFCSAAFTALLIYFFGRLLES
jgi:hypothetical protein